MTRDPNSTRGVRGTIRRSPLASAVAALAVGAVVAIVAVKAARALDVDAVGQTVIAFACVGAALMVFAALRPAKDSDPLAAVGAVIAVATALVAALSYVGPIERQPALGCINSDGALDATVSGETTIIYSRATAASDAKGLLLRGCRIHPVGYCIGAIHQDAIESKVLETRWFILPDGRGLVPAGRTASTIPAGRKPEHCPGSVAAPDEVRFTAAVLDRAAKTLRLAAQAPRAAYIGFALHAADGSWHRIGWDPTPEDKLPLDAPAYPGVKPGAEIAAVPCIGFKRPAAVLARARVRSGRAQPTQIEPVPQPRSSTPGAAACNSAIPPPVTTP